MLERMEVFNKYYQSDRFKNELKLPDRPSFHHFRFQVFQDNRFRRVKDIISTKEVLEKLIIKNTPKNVFFTPVKWLDPVNVRRQQDDQIKDHMLSSPLYFDIDSDLTPEKTFESALEATKKLISILKKEKGREPDWIVFSGRRGFHVYYWNWDNIQNEPLLSESKIIVFRQNREKILCQLLDKGVIVDKSVTSDPWRVMRVPGTLHGETGLIAKIITNLDDFCIEKASFSL
jgi:DNA primase catalytic subunit